MPEVNRKCRSTENWGKSFPTEFYTQTSWPSYGKNKNAISDMPGLRKKKRGGGGGNRIDSIPTT